MKHDGDVQELQKERDQEAALLRTRMSTLVDTIEHKASPAEWVRKHPFLATGGAALAGFAAAQLPVSRVAGAVHAAATKKSPPPATLHTDYTPAAGLPWAEMMQVVVSLAQRFLTHPDTDADAPPASVNVGDAGAVSGDNFPPLEFRPGAHTATASA